MPFPVQVVGFVFLLSAPIAVAIWSVSGLPFPVIYSGIVAVASMLALLARHLFKTWDAESSDFKDRLDSRKAETTRLTVEEARKQAIGFLADPAAYELRDAGPIPDRVAKRLGPSLLEFFGRYPHVQSRYSAFTLDRSAVAESFRSPGFMLVGRDSDTIEILAAAHEDAVALYSVEFDLAEGPDLEFPSIFHYLVFEHRLHHEPH
jgi:hypothetical protein